MSGMLFLLFVQSLFQFGAKQGKSEGYYGETNYLDMSFYIRSTMLCVTVSDDSSIGNVEFSIVFALQVTIPMCFPHLIIHEHH